MAQTVPKHATLVSQQVVDVPELRVLTIVGLLNGWLATSNSIRVNAYPLSGAVAREHFVASFALGFLACASVGVYRKRRPLATVRLVAHQNG